MTPRGLFPPELGRLAAEGHRACCHGAQHPKLCPNPNQVGHGGGPWHTDNPTCRGCAGLRARWLDTAAAAAGGAPRPLSFDALLARAAFRGRILLAPDEPHALLPALTLAGLESLLPVTTCVDVYVLGPT